MSTTISGDRPTSDELAGAARLFAEASDRPDLQLEAILLSVGAALSLLRKDHDWSHLAPIQYLFAGLSRLAAGRPDPVLKPLREDKKAGRQGGPESAMLFKKLYILLAHELLCRGEWMIGEADSRVAKMATAAGWKSSDGKPISGDMVRGWRCDVGLPEMSLVEEQLEVCKSMLDDSPDPRTVEHAAEQLIKHGASSFAGIEISGNPTLL